MEAIVKSEKDIESTEWIKLPFPGCTVRILGRNEETGACGILFKMEPGAELPRHGHPSTEQSMSLEGEVEIEGKKYGPGSYLYNPPAIEHGPFKAGAKGWIAYCAFDGPTGMEEAIGMSAVRK